MAKREVKIEISKKTYDFIDGATGEKITQEEFAERYPAVAIGGLSVGNGQKKNDEGSKENNQ